MTGSTLNSVKSSVMSYDTVSPLDENTRRYYLDAMGVQCWQLRDTSETLVAQENNNLSWSQLESDIQSCTHCQLHQSRKQPICGRGNTNADLFFILLAPTQSDDESGKLCDAEANALFSKMLSAIEISIDDVYITSLLKCSVPAVHTVSPKEIQSCNTYLQQQLQLIQPRLVIVLGETTNQCLFQKTLSLDDFRAMNIDSPQQINAIPLFTSYSPEELLQHPENKRDAWLDLQQIKKMLGSNKT